MQVLVHTDSNIEGSQALAQHVETVVAGTLERFSDQITRVEVRLTDENSSQKDSANDKRCVMEARLAGQQPIIVSDQGASLDQAIDGAMDKLERTLNRTIERLHDHKGRTSFGGDQTI